MRNDLNVVTRIKRELNKVIETREKILDEYRNDNNINVYTKNLSLILYALGDITTYLISNKNKLTNKKYSEIMEILDVNKMIIDNYEYKISKEQFLKTIKSLQFDFSKIIDYIIETKTNTELITSAKKGKRVIFDIYNQYGIDYLKKLYLSDEVFTSLQKSAINLFDFLSSEY